MANALTSALTQNCGDYEVIVVDDCSSDGSYELAQKFQREHDKVSIYRNETNLGITGNWNRCIELAKGKYIVILHQDDELREGALKKESDLLNKHLDVGVVFGNTHVIYLPKGRHIIYPGWDTSFTIKGQDFAPYMLNHMNVIYCPTVMIRKSCFEEFGVFDERYKIYEDYEMWLRLALKGVGFAFLESVLAVYNYHETNTSKRVIREGLNIRECRLLLDTHEPEILDIYGDKGKAHSDNFKKTFAYLCLGYALNLLYNGHYDSARNQLNAAQELYPQYKRQPIVRLMRILGSLKIIGRIGIIGVEEFSRRTRIRRLLEKRVYKTATELPSPITLLNSM